MSHNLIFSALGPRQKYSFSDLVASVDSKLWNDGASLHNQVLVKEVIHYLFARFLSQGDIRDIEALSCVSKCHRDVASRFWGQFSLQRFCPKGLTILNLKAQGFLDVDEPKIKECEVLKAFYKIAPRVTNNLGCTLLTMHKGFNFNELVNTGKAAGMKVGLCMGNARSGIVAIERPYVILIANHSIQGSEEEEGQNKELMAAKLGCRIATIQESFALCIYGRDLFDNKQLLRSDILSSTVYNQKAGALKFNIGLKKNYNGSQPSFAFIAVPPSKRENFGVVVSKEFQST